MAKINHTHPIRIYAAGFLCCVSTLSGCSLLSRQATVAPTATSPTAVSTIVATALVLPTTTTSAPAVAATVKATVAATPSTGTGAAATAKPIATATPAPAENASLNIVTVTSTDKNAKQFYEITRNAPKLQGGKQAAAVTAFNTYVNGILDKDVTKYKAEFIKNGKPAGFDGFNYLETNYTVLAVNPSFVSLRLNESYYYAGGAHPNTSSIAINYDLEKRAPILLAAQFKPGANYLKALSDYATKVLIDDLKDALFKEGLQPKADNFKNWGISDQGLVLYFDPYQVAPYAAGPKEVIVPKAALSSILNPSGQLAKTAK